MNRKPSSHKSSDLKFCNCFMCRNGRHHKHGKKTWGKFIVKYTRRKYRHLVKRMLKQGQEPPEKFGVTYTD